VHLSNIISKDADNFLKTIL